MRARRRRAARRRAAAASPLSRSSLRLRLAAAVAASPSHFSLAAFSLPAFSLSAFSLTAFSLTAFSPAARRTTTSVLQSPSLGLTSSSPTFLPSGASHPIPVARGPTARRYLRRSRSPCPA